MEGKSHPAAGRDNTVLIAVAGIAATALVGLAAAVGGWLNARDDRREQSALARQSLNYERRVAVYLDAIDFVETQEKAFYEYGTLAENQFRKAPVDLPRHFPLPKAYAGEFIPYEEAPPQRLVSRLRALGSSAATDEFQQVETLITKIPAKLVDSRGQTFLRTNFDADRSVGKALRQFDPTYRAFYNEITEFEKTVHSELGVG